MATHLKGIPRGREGPALRVAAEIETHALARQTRVGGNRVAWNHVPVDVGASRSAGRLVVITGLPGSGKTTLATKLAALMPACRMCPDDWMVASGINLWDESARTRIEAFQLTLTLDQLRAGNNVVVEWGTWARAERDALRDAARSIGAAVELRYVSADADELWQRIVDRNLEGRWGSRSIRRHELDEWMRVFQPPTEEEMATYDVQQPSSISMARDRRRTARSGLARSGRFLFRPRPIDGSAGWSSEGAT